MFEVADRETAERTGAERRYHPACRGRREFGSSWCIKESRGRSDGGPPLRLLRIDPRRPEQYSFRLRPEDVLELPKLAQMLAAAFVADDSIEPELRTTSAAWPTPLAGS